MAPSVVYARASTTLTSSSNPSVLRSLNSLTIQRRQAIAVRSLWWWSRHGTWPSANDENVEECFQRHQRILRHRYSRALRRRAMWDREDNVSSWLWCAPENKVGRKWGGCRTMSSNDPHKDQVNEKPEGLSSPEKFWAKTQKDFEKFDKRFDSFKAAIDRAIEKDPYGTLFGRPLQSPPTQNNSSWISWLFNGLEAKEQPLVYPTETSVKRNIPIEVLEKDKQPVATPQQAPAIIGTALDSNIQSKRVIEYIYDPVSGRKVPQSLVRAEDAPQAKQNFLATLFSEHGSGPDKPVKEGKVYGYKANAAKQSTVPQENRYGGVKAATDLENSRKREYRQLRAATLGTSIDTTAEFGGKYETEPSVEIESESEIRTMPDPADDAPLFTDTAYASRANKTSQGPSNRSSSWLEKEGFRKQSSKIATVDNSNVKPDRLEPSLDRMQSTTEASHDRKFVTKLQPAIDRVQLAKPKVESLTVRPPLEVMPSTVHRQKDKAISSTSRGSLETDQREDVDLLRASDVRAATRIARTTKQEVEEAKSQARIQLEAAFEALQKKQPDEVITNAKKLRADSVRLSRSIDSVWKYTEKYPDGVVAQTMKSMGTVNEDLKKSQLPYPLNKVNGFDTVEAGRSSVTTSPAARGDYGKSITTPVITMKSSNAAGERTHETQNSDDAQIEKLAIGIREIYEAEHGPIDLSLAQNSEPTVISEPTTSAQSSKAKETSADQTDFFTEQADFLSEVSQLAKDVQSIKERTSEFEAEVNNNSLNSSDASANVRQLTSEAKSYLQKVESLHEKFDSQMSQKQTHPLRTATVKTGVPRYPVIERHTQVFEPKFIQLRSDLKSVKRNLQEVSTILHDLKRSNMKKEPQAPSPIVTEASSQTRVTQPKPEVPIASAFTASTAPYLILTYNKSTGEIDHTAMDRLPWTPDEKVDKVNPIRVMGNLNYPAAFVTHFVKLEQAGYELSSGGGDMLIFQMKVNPTSSSERTVTPSVVSASNNLRNTVAAEVSAQPEISETIAQPKGVHAKHAATVLDDIPADIPQPGPAAPTAPPATNPFRKAPRLNPKVRRQEQVFSGTIPFKSSQSSSTKPQDNTTSSAKDDTSNETHKPHFFARTTRTIKRGIIGVVGIGAAAYTIGVVAEGIGAQAQVEGESTAGPRRKMVMPNGQRPGIYSTESSRD